MTTTVPGSPGVFGAPPNQLEAAGREGRVGVYWGTAWQAATRPGAMVGWRLWAWGVRGGKGTLLPLFLGEWVRVWGRQVQLQLRQLPAHATPSSPIQSCLDLAKQGQGGLVGERGEGNG